MYALPYLLIIRLHRLALDARRRERTWRYYAYSVAAGVLAALLAGIALLAAFVMFYAGWWPLGIIAIVLFVLPPLQPSVNRHVLAPLGLVRTTFWLAHFVSMDDSDAYALCCAAWAHAMKPTPEGEAWLLTRRDRRVPLGDAEIIVTALLAAGRGDADAARQLMRSTAEMVENHALVRELAGEWLAVDAADRGAWKELYEDAIAARWPASSLTFLLEGIAARRLAAAGAPSTAEVRVRWLLAPHRRATARLLAEAAPRPEATSGATTTDATAGATTDATAGATTTGATAGATTDATAGATTDATAGATTDATAGATTDATAGAMADATSGPAGAGAPRLPRALAAHLELAGGHATADRLARTVAAWDAALLDGATQTWLARRALELDAPSGAVDRAIRDVASAVTDELARIADAAHLAAPASHGPVGEGLARRLRHGRLDALEAGFTRWEERRHSGAVRAPIDEWREWVALRAAYDAAVGSGGLVLRRLAFPHAYSKGTSMAVWLWNTRNEYALSHAISKWLLAEALAVGDTEAIELCTRNCRLAVPTRTGEVRS